MKLKTLREVLTMKKLKKIIKSFRLTHLLCDRDLNEAIEKGGYKDFTDFVNQALYEQYLDVMYQGKKSNMIETKKGLVK